MISNKQRNGSALLIVLGMVAFMIVSAAGFAAREISLETALAAANEPDHLKQYRRSVT